MNEIEAPKAPPVYVPPGVPRQVALTKCLSGLTGFWLIFGGLFAGIGGVVALAFGFAATGKEKLVALFPLLFVVIGAFALRAGINGFAKKRKLYVWGDLATGRVTDVETTNTRVNDQPVLRIKYTFPGPMGEVSGSTDNLKAPPVGAEVSVLYDRNDPGVNVLPLPGTFN